MAFLVVAALLLAGIAAVLFGAVASSASAFTFGALCAAAAVVLLWRHNVAQRESTFVSRPPDISLPDWDRPLREAQTGEDNLERDVPEVAIDEYDQLVAAEILPSLETLSIAELEAVIDRERSGLGRVAVINRAQTLIDLTTPDAESVISTVEAPAEITVEITEPSAEQTIDPDVAPVRSRSARGSGKSAERASSPSRSRSESAAKRPPQRNGASETRRSAARPSSTPRNKNTRNQKERKGPDLSI